MVKSPLEIACMRKAAGIADIGMLAGRDTIEAGMTEIDVMSEIHYAMGRAGGEDAALRTAITCGPLSMPHKPSTRYQSRAGGHRLRRYLRCVQPLPRQPLPLLLARQAEPTRSHDRAKLLADLPCPPLSTRRSPETP